MTQLFLDTTLSDCNAYIFRDGEVIARMSETLGRGHAERLLPMVEETMAEAGVVYEQLSEIICVTGPGTFTGVRVAIAAAQGLALATGASLYGISVFDLMALSADTTLPQPLHACVAARGGLLQWQSFELMDGCWMPSGDVITMVLAESEVGDMPQAGTIVGVFLPGATLSEAEAALGLNIQQAKMSPDAICRAVTAGQVKGEAVPLYMREADAIRAKPVFQYQ